jgi:hypothetical protein
VNRRAFLGAVGSAASLGYVGRPLASLLDPTRVRVWVTDAAAECDGLEPRVEGYLRAAFEDVLDDLSIHFADPTVSLSAEGGREVLADEWPRRVLEGAAGLSGVDPVGGVNLLVTDGDPTATPAGFARPHIAAVTGASYIADMPPAAVAGERVDYSVRAVATQLLAHESGHAFGADHEHGSATVRDGALVASPMVGSYLWSSADVREKHLSADGECGPTSPVDPSLLDRALALRYSACAASAIRDRYDEPLPSVAL